MKSSKTKSIRKPKIASEVGRTVKSKKVTISKSVPSEEEICKKANEIYHKRIACGDHGTALDDWHKAEDLLRNS